MKLVTAATNVDDDDDDDDDDDVVDGVVANTSNILSCLIIARPTSQQRFAHVATSIRPTKYHSLTSVLAGRRFAVQEGKTGAGWSRRRRQDVTHVHAQRVSHHANVSDNSAKYALLFIFHSLPAAGVVL